MKISLADMRFKRKRRVGGWNIKQGVICRWQEIGVTYVKKQWYGEWRVMEVLELDFVIIKLKKKSPRVTTEEKS